MDSTAVSLLRRLRSDGKEQAWERFVEMYAPLIYHWAFQTGLSSHDSADCVQEVLLVLFDKLPTFAYDPNKSFQAWLQKVTLNKCRDAIRKQATIARATIPLSPKDLEKPDDIALFTEQEYVEFVVHRALEVMQSEFETTTWQACCSLVMDGTSAAEVARQLNLSENAVYLAKSRVLRRLRAELDGLLD